MAFKGRKYIIEENLERAQEALSFVQVRTQDPTDWGFQSLSQQKDYWQNQMDEELRKEQ